MSGPTRGDGGGARSPGPTRATMKMGNTMPSFKPLSMFRAFLILTGTRGLLTMGSARPASVGVRMMARRSASSRVSPGKRIEAPAIPARMVRGRPIARSRTGTEMLPQCRGRLIRAASVKRVSTRVSSTRIRTRSCPRPYSGAT